MVIYLLLLVVSTLSVVGQTEASSDCNWWCKIKSVFSENVVGKAGTSPEVFFEAFGALYRVENIGTDNQIIYVCGSTSCDVICSDCYLKSNKGNNYIFKSTTNAVTSFELSDVTPGKDGLYASSKKITVLDMAKPDPIPFEISHKDNHIAIGGSISLFNEGQQWYLVENGQKQAVTFQEVKRLISNKCYSSRDDCFFNQEPIVADHGSEPTKGAAATFPTTGAAAGTPSCSSIPECQQKLKDKEILPSEAYTAIKALAEQEEAALKATKEKYDSTIKSLGDKIGSDGNLKPSIKGSDLDQAGTVLGVPRETPEFKVKEKIIGYTGDEYTVVQGTIEDGQKYLQVTADDPSDTSCKPNCLIAVDQIKSEDQLKKDEFGFQRASGEPVKDETDEALRKKTQAKLDSLKPDEAKSKASKEAADSLYWQSTWLDDLNAGTKYTAVKDFGKVVSGTFGLVGALGSYRGVSNLLFPDASKNWMEWANSETVQLWADLPGYVSAEVCGVDDAKRANQPGQAARFITTSSGTYQFVGAISAEKTAKKFPILCSKNDKDEWTCPKDLVCNDDTYCYKDKKSIRPEEGYFYKITWGVTAPSDEKFTPYVDEAGSAVKFNVYLDTSIHLYTRKGVTDPKQVIQLANGAHDGGMIVRYLPTEYNQVCIRFASNGIVKDRGGEDVDEICASIKPSEGGVVEYSQSGRVETISSTSAEVELNI